MTPTRRHPARRPGPVRGAAWPLTVLLVLSTLWGTGLPAARAHAATPPDDPVRALSAAARPLRTTEPHGPDRDLAAFGAMVGPATVVGFGEATHSSHEFFALKHRAFRYLVEHRGFRGFSLEAPWSTGLRLNDYLLRGRGDPLRIFREDFQDAYLFWRTWEYLDLIHWMRAYNVAHPHDPVQFSGNDIGYAGPELYDRVTGYVRATRPALLPEVERLYRGLRPTLPAGEHMRAYATRPLAERREAVRRTHRVVELLTARRPGRGAAAREAHTWAVRHAVSLEQTARQYAYDFDDPDDVRRSMSYRDRIMAENTVWWHRQTGAKVLLSAHNGHVFYVNYEPGFPDIQGAFLRDLLGSRYLAVGLTFHHGSANATRLEDPLVDENVRTVTLGPPPSGTNEYTLDRVPHRDFLIDMRTAPAAARDWLARPRPSRMFGTAYPVPDAVLALGESADVLVHLHQVRAADRLPFR
ncbi:erythromycin esterase family protein [Streptomyces pactum]|uniref:erythromycin esterase family protein n=1 Tax=Streptomyces pactum TaxID=68249 RepID=UPI0036FF1187